MDTTPAMTFQKPIPFRVNVSSPDVRVEHLTFEARRIAPSMTPSMYTLGEVGGGWDIKFRIYSGYSEKWQISVPDGSLPLAGALPQKDACGMPAGEYVVTCWVDDGSGVFKPSENHFGFGIFSTDDPEPVEIELTGASSVFPRINLAAAIAAQRAHNDSLAAAKAALDAAYAADPYVDANAIAAANAYQAAIDAAYADVVEAAGVARYRRAPGVEDTAVLMARTWSECTGPSSILHEDGVVPTSSAIDEYVTPDSRFVRVWIVLDKLNNRRSVGSEVIYSSYRPIMYLGVIDLDKHPILTEADIMMNAEKSGVFDLGWGTVPKTYLDIGQRNIGSLVLATFAIILDEVPNANYFRGNRLLAIAVKNSYAYGIDSPAVADKTVVAVSPRPTFSWKNLDGVGKSYPAFQLKIWDSTGTAVVYDSGIRRAPAPNADDGVTYRWTAPIVVGELTPQGVVFEADTDYIWDVSLLDAKFTTFGGSFENGAALRVPSV